METGLNYSKPALAAIIRVAKDIRKTLDTTAAMSYIKRKFSGVEFYEGSLAFATEEFRQMNFGLEKHSVNEIITSQAKKARKLFF